MAKTKVTAKTKVKNKKKDKVKTQYKVRPNCTTYTCRYDDCKKAFTNSSLRQVHEKLHLGETHACPSCTYVGTTRKYLTSHIRKMHVAKKKYKCKECDMLFHFPSALKKHSWVHTGEKPYQCSVCEKTFRARYSLNCHMLIHNDQKPHQCSFCDYACRDTSTLRKHQNIHMGLGKTYTCRICRKKFTEKRRLKYHISHVHLDYLDVVVKTYPCNICNKAYKQPHLLKRHVQTVHDRALACTCPICEKPVSCRYNLSQHMSTHFAEKPFACTHEGCGATFKDKSSLKKHTVIHYPRLHFACKICNRTFARERRRDTHMLQHQAKKKNVQCDYCNVKFYNKNYLIQHIKRKHCSEKNKKKYICDHCDLITYNKPSIVMHLKYGHCLDGDEDLKCKICKNKSYKKFEYLKCHYLRTHNVKYRSMNKVKRKKKTPSIVIKIEPIEEEDKEEIILLEIDKQEPAEPPEDEYVTYSKHVLSEDLAEYMLDESAVDTNFDLFLKKHVFHDKIKDEDDPTQSVKVHKEQRQYVMQKIKELLKTTKEEKERKKTLKQKIREEKIKLRLKKREIIELKKVRKFYNLRMKKAVDCQKESPKELTYFDNQVQYKDKIIFENDEWKENDKINEIKSENTQEDDNKNDTQNDSLNDEINNDALKNDDKSNDGTNMNDAENDLNIIKRNTREKTNRNYNENDDDDGNNDEEDDTEKVKLELKTHQCYSCFKLFPNIEILNEHRIKSHAATNLRNTLVKTLDKKNREIKDKTITKTKLVKKGKEWIIEKVPIKIKYEKLPRFSLNELRNLRVCDNFVDRLGQINQLAKEKGIKMYFPCDKCEKICKNFPAIKLHSRRHDPNKKPFKPKQWKHKGQIKPVPKKPRVDTSRQLAKPGPITHKHKCDDKLKEFYETYIRGENIEFAQFLKIYNKMEREDIKDFTDFEGRIDFGVHNKDTYCQNLGVDGEKSGKEMGKRHNKDTYCQNLGVDGEKSGKIMVKRRKFFFSKNRKFYRSLSKKMYLEREEAKKKLREKIAQSKLNLM